MTLSVRSKLKHAVEGGIPNNGRLQPSGHIQPSDMSVHSKLKHAVEDAVEHATPDNGRLQPSEQETKN